MYLYLSKGISLSKEKIQQGNCNKKHGALIKTNMKAMFFVNKLSTMAFMLKRIFLIQKPAVPYQVVSDFHQRLILARNQVLKRALFNSYFEADILYLLLKLTTIFQSGGVRIWLVR